MVECDLKEQKGVMVKDALVRLALGDYINYAILFSDAIGCSQ